MTRLVRNADGMNDAPDLETSPVPIMVTCSCGKQFQTKVENAGRRARCPECGKELIVPGVGVGASGDIAGDFGHAPVKGAEAGTSGKAIASFVLGLTSLICTLFTGIPAIILGALSVRAIGRSGGRITGSAMAIVGIVTGSLSVVIIPVLIALLIPAVQAAR